MAVTWFFVTVLVGIFAQQASAQFQTWYTYSGDQCRFPFSYKGVLYTACTETDNFQPWCGTVALVPDSVPLPSTWGYCYGTSPPNGLPYITPKYADCDRVILTTNGHQCSIPFSFNNVDHESCITDNNNGIPWCALDRVYTGRWGNCDLSDCPVTPGDSTTCNVLTTSGSRCYFPFTYQGQVYRQCTNVNTGDFWCALSSTFDGRYGNCALNYTTAGEQCVFPFTYNNQVFQGCTTEGHAGGVAWCSLDAVYRGHWGACNLCP